VLPWAVSVSPWSVLKAWTCFIWLAAHVFWALAFFTRFMDHGAAAMKEVEFEVRGPWNNNRNNNRLVATWRVKSREMQLRRADWTFS